MPKINVVVAYIWWCACFIGFCGMHRIYIGKHVSGAFYLLTFGFCGLGQFLDLLLIPNLVESRNRYIDSCNAEIASRPTSQKTNSNPNTSIQKTMPPIAPPMQKIRPSTTSRKASVSSKTSMQKLLRAAKCKNSVLSLAQAAMLTELEPEPLKVVLEQAVREGYADIENDPISGAIRYRFDL